MGVARGVVNDVSPRLRAFAKDQRSMQTRAERLLWQQLRAGRLRGHKFKRQVPLAPFIADFLCIAARLVVELDGPPHDAAERRARDAERDRWLVGQGFRVVRFQNDEVLGNCDRVIELIVAAIEGGVAPSPAPLRGAPSPAEGERVGVSARATA